MLPIRASQIDTTFRVTLRDAYEADYGRPGLTSRCSILVTFNDARSSSLITKPRHRVIPQVQDGDFVRVKRGNIVQKVSSVTTTSSPIPGVVSSSE